MNDNDIGVLCQNAQLRSRIQNVGGSTSDLEGLSLLALRMNALGMKPSDWFRTISRG